MRRSARSARRARSYRPVKLPDERGYLGNPLLRPSRPRIDCRSLLRYEKTYRAVAEKPPKPLDARRFATLRDTMMGQRGRQ